MNGNNGLNIFHAPRIMLWLIALNVGLWVSLIPLVAAVRTARLDYIPLTLIGLLLIPLVLIAGYIHRLILYVFVWAYWYIVGFFAALGVLWGAVVVWLLLIDPGSVLDRSPVPIPDNPPIGDGPLVQAAAGFIVLMLIVGAFMLGRRTRPTAAEPPPSVVNAEDDVSDFVRRVRRRHGVE